MLTREQDHLQTEISRKTIALVSEIGVIPAKKTARGEALREAINRLPSSFTVEEAARNPA